MSDSPLHSVEDLSARHTWVCEDMTSLTVKDRTSLTDAVRIKDGFTQAVGISGFG